MNREYYIRLRNKYYPENLKQIFILESPPISGKFFYEESGKKTEPLFSEMMKLLKFSPENKPQGLEYFKNAGFFLVDATYKPVNDLKGKKRDATILQDFNRLVNDLNQICAGKNIPVILVKANICRLLEEPLRRKGFSIQNNGLIIPFPSTGQQKRFHTEMNKIFRVE